MPEHVDDFARKQLIAVLKSEAGQAALELGCDGCCGTEGYSQSCPKEDSCVFCIFDETGREALLQELEASTSN